mmetsp:Transcript_105152/g.206254  ORF Transcript_105152/g.206254 Transcript_105152/m.206254 type:complete len:80 (+) Transcript_105152:2333-2572(+)
MISAHYGHTEVVKMLVAAGMKVDQRDSVVCLWAVRHAFSDCHAFMGVDSHLFLLSSLSWRFYAFTRTQVPFSISIRVPL